MSAVALQESGRAVQVEFEEVTGPILRGGAVPKAIGDWMADRAGRENVAGVSVRGRVVVVELEPFANGAEIAEHLGLEAVASGEDVARWMGVVFGCKVVAEQGSDWDQVA